MRVQICPATFRARVTREIHKESGGGPIPKSSRKWFKASESVPRPERVFLGPPRALSTHRLPAPFFSLLRALHAQATRVARDPQGGPRVPVDYRCARRGAHLRPGDFGFGDNPASNAFMRWSVKSARNSWRGCPGTALPTSRNGAAFCTHRVAVQLCASCPALGRLIRLRLSSMPSSPPCRLSCSSLEDPVNDVPTLLGGLFLGLSTCGAPHRGCAVLLHTYILLSTNRRTTLSRKG